MRLIYQPIYWTYRTVSSVWYWAQRRFTTAGLCVFGGFLVAGATGLDVESTVTYQSFAALLGLLLIAFAGVCFPQASSRLRRFHSDCF